MSLGSNSSLHYKNIRKKTEYYRLEMCFDGQIRNRGYTNSRGHTGKRVTENLYSKEAVTDLKKILTLKEFESVYVSEEIFKEISTNDTFDMNKLIEKCKELEGDL